MNRRQSRAERQGVDANPVRVCECVATDIKRVRPALERVDRGRDILGSPDFRCDDIEAELAGRCRNLAHLLNGAGKTDIGQDRKSADTRETSRNSSRRLPARSVDWTDRPVTLPPGRAREATKPLPTGSASIVKTMGMTDVACLSTGTAPPTVTMTSTFSRTNSAAISAKRSLRPSAQRNSIATVRPSIQPSSRSRCTNAAIRWPSAEAVLDPNNPMVRSLLGCCARAASGHVRHATEERDDLAPLQLIKLHFNPACQYASRISYWQWSVSGHQRASTDGSTTPASRLRSH